MAHMGNNLYAPFILKWSDYMVITDIILKKNKSQYDIYIENGQKITVDISLAIKYDIKKDKIIDDIWLERLENEIGFHNAYNYSLRLLSIKARTTGEIKNKLQLKDFSFEIISKTIDKLIDIGYLNDEKYIDDFLNEKGIMPGMSRKALYYKLLYKGLDKNLLNRKFNESTINEYETAIMAAKKKVKTIKGDKKIIRNKLYLYLKGKGYYDDVCIKAINTVLSHVEWE